MRTGAAAVIIGNEVLSAKVKDENGSFLIQQFSEQQIALKWMCVVADEIDAIVEAVNIARRRARYVLTSGGIGPTHDDVTVRAVAQALGRGVVRNPELEGALKEKYGSDFPEEGFRLAEVPEGSVLLPQPGSWYPIITCENVYLLPGVPQLFRRQLSTLLPTFDKNPVYLTNVYLNASEVEIAQVLDRAASGAPDVAIGSYPTFGPDQPYRVKITVEHHSPEMVREVVARLVSAFPAGSVLKVE